MPDLRMLLLSLERRLTLITTREMFFDVRTAGRHLFEFHFSLRNYLNCCYRQKTVTNWSLGSVYPLIVDAARSPAHLIHNMATDDLNQ